MARTQNLSDANTVKAKIVARESLYSDFDLAFLPHPNTGDITTLRDIDAVKQSIRNLILTIPGERPFEPRLGSKIRGLLFEPVDPFTALDMKEAIEEVVLNFEPRVKLLDVDIKSEEDNNRYAVSLTYQIITSQQTGDVNFYLERIR